MGGAGPMPAGSTSGSRPRVWPCVERDAYVTDPRHDGRLARSPRCSPRRDLDAARRPRIDPAACDAARSRVPCPAGGGTIYITTADRWGNAVSLLESNYQGFGSGLVDPGHRHRLPRPRRVLPPGPVTPNALAPRQAPHPHARSGPAPARRPCPGSSTARWAARSSRRCSPSSSRPWSMAGQTWPRPWPPRAGRR